MADYRFKNDLDYMPSNQPKPARPEDIPQATLESEQEFFGVKVRTYVLDDGRRIINAEDFHKLMAVMGKS